MEMHQLRYFVTVARTGNFSRAAEQCHVAQPSLSQQIQKLENELGQRLFLRLGRRTQLTRAGETLLARALRVLEEVSAAEREVRDAEDEVRGLVTIGILPTVAPYLLPGPARAFLERFPAVELRIIEDQTAALARLLAASDIDLALMPPPVAMRGLQGQPLCEDELLVALPHTHRLAKKKRLAPQDLESDPWIVMSDGHCLGDQVMRFREQFVPGARVSFRCAQIETIRHFVAAGLGIALVPAMAARASDVSLPLVYRPVADTPPVRRLAVLWSEKRPPGRASTEFLSLLKSSLPAHSAEPSPTTHETR